MTLSKQLIILVAKSSHQTTIEMPGCNIADAPFIRVFLKDIGAQIPQVAINNLGFNIRSCLLRLTR